MGDAAKVSATPENRRFLGESKTKVKRLLRRQTDLCLICEQKAPFANSHTIPRSSLEEITSKESGELLTPAFFAPILRDDKNTSVFLSDRMVGVNSALTWRLICQKCDGEVFEEYENNFHDSSWTWTSRSLAEVALKNELCEWAALRVKDASSTLSPKDLATAKNAFQKQVNQSLTFSSFIHALERAVHGQNGWSRREAALAKFKAALISPEDAFTILLSTELNYITPVAIQRTFMVDVLPDNSFFQEVCDPNLSHATEVQIAVLPTRNQKTKVLVFCESSEARLIEEWPSASKEKILKWIWLLSCRGKDTGFIMSPHVSHKWLADPHIRDAFVMESAVCSDRVADETLAINLTPLKQFQESHPLYKNFLNSQYKLRPDAIRGKPTFEDFDFHDELWVGGEDEWPVTVTIDEKAYNAFTNWCYWVQTRPFDLAVLESVALQKPWLTKTSPPLESMDQWFALKPDLWIMRPSSEDHLLALCKKISKVLGRKITLRLISGDKD